MEEITDVFALLLGSPSYHWNPMEFPLESRGIPLEFSLESNGIPLNPVEFHWNYPFPMENVPFIPLEFQSTDFFSVGLTLTMYVSCTREVITKFLKRISRKFRAFIQVFGRQLSIFFLFCVCSQLLKWKCGKKKILENVTSLAHIFMVYRQGQKSSYSVTL